MQHDYAPLAQYFLYLEHAYNLHLCVKDYVGFIPIDKELSSALFPYLGHNTPYCLYVKQDRERYRHCLSMMKKIAAKCIRDGASFCGTCYAGVREYVVPIVCDGQLLGAITAGFFPVPEAEARSRIARAMDGAPAQDVTHALSLYRAEILPTSVPEQVLLPALEFAASYLAMTYRMARESQDTAQLVSARKNTGADAVYRQALDYIHQNATRAISVASVASACHCSQSAISHMLKKRLGVGLSTYVNKLRVERAKDLLLNTDDTIASICQQLGYLDANYFSRVFVQLMNISPSEFRRRYR